MQMIKLTTEDRAKRIKDMAGQSRSKLEEEKKREESRDNWPWLRRALYQVVSTSYFDMITGVIILFNICIVVIEADATADGGKSPVWAQVSTNTLLFIYTTELSAKLYVYRCDFWSEMWNVLDFFIVSTDFVFILVTLALDDMPSVAILRTFRILRLARALKAAKAFKELHALVRACACALKAIFWGMFMVGMALVVWGILAVQLIHPINKTIAANTPHVYDGCDRCPRAYSTVFHSILTFWKQIVAGDSWGSLCEPIIEEAPWTAIFFVLVFVTVNLTMLNCILAVVVEAGAAAAVADEHEEAMNMRKRVQKAEEQIIDICQGLDTDNSGHITEQEFLNGYREDEAFRDCMHLMNITEEDIDMIFNICDEDDSGDVNYREFVENLRRMKNSGEKLLLNYVTDIKHQVMKLKPEYLKPHGWQLMDEYAELTDPLKRRSTRSVISRKSTKSESPRRTGQLAVAATSTEEVPVALADVPSKSISFSDDAQIVDMKVLDDTQIVIDDLACREKLERSVRVCIDDLAASVRDLAVQSKTQTQVLSTLVDSSRNNSAGIDRYGDGYLTFPLASRCGSRNSMDPDVVRAGQNGDRLDLEPTAHGARTCMDHYSCAPVRVV